MFSGLWGCKISSTFYIATRCNASYTLYIGQCFYTPIQLQRIAFNSSNLRVPWIVFVTFICIHIIFQNILGSYTKTISFRCLIKQNQMKWTIKMVCCKGP